MIKRWLLKTFYKKELSEIHKYYQGIVEEIRRSTNKKTNMIEIVHSVLQEKNHVIIGEAINKMNEQLLVVQWVFGDEIWLKLYSERYNVCNRHPRIMATYVAPYGKCPYIKIDDILVEDNEVGNGSILMTHFIEYCRKTDAKYICGELSSEDNDHFDRLEHFYKKHGFDVEFNNNRSSGSIKYTI